MTKPDQYRWTIRDGEWVKVPIITIPRQDRIEFFDSDGTPRGVRLFQITPENDAIVAAAGY